jgi:hypothetical protein
MIQKNATTKMIQYFDGVNFLTASNIAKINELTHAENGRSPSIGTIEKREGMEVIGKTAADLSFVATENYSVFYFSNSFNTGLYRVSTVGGVTSIYYLNSLGRWIPLTGLGTSMTPNSIISTCEAEDNLYMVNQGLTSRYILGTDGTTVYDSTLASLSTANLYNCPQANIINYYKGRLYIADYAYGSVQYHNTVLMSSSQLGILSLVNQDALSTDTVIEITDNKYFIVGEAVEFRRGATVIGTKTIASIQETTITLSSALGVALDASDEIWVNGTYSGKKVFRWVTNPTMMGVNAKNYDTFKLSTTTDNDSETINVMTNVGNVMLIASSSSMAIWNSYVLQNLDFGIGCCSKRAHVKSGGSLYFLHYTGVYTTEGATPKYISSKIEPYIQGATKAGLEAASAGKKGRNIFFCIGDVTLKNPDGSTDKILKDVCVEYSITQQNWYVHTNWKLRRMVTYVSSTNSDSLVGISTFSDKPIVELLVAGKNTDVADASGTVTEIPFRADTPNIMSGTSFQFISYPLEIDVEMERGSGMKCFVSLDRGDWYELEGEASKGLTIFKVTSKDGDTSKPPRCRNIRISFRHIGKQLCKISKVAVISMQTPEEEQFKEDGK